MSEESRALLAEYADRLVTVTVNGTEYRRALGVLGGEIFRALENVLSYIETERVKYKAWEGDSACDSAAVVLDDIEDTIRKALEG